MKYKSYIDENVGDEIDSEIMKDILAESGGVIIPDKSSKVVQTLPIENEHSNDENIIVTNSSPEESIIFKVQISAGSTKVDLKSYNFNGLEPISRESSEGLYRYFYDNPENYTEALLFQEKAKQAGYETSYIVAYKNGKRISLGEALNSN
jgi:N-acetylmuramoyl-L-alanine amidase